MLLRQRQGRQPLRKLDHDVLPALVHPARHSVARDPGQRNRAETLARELVDGEQVRRPITGVPQHLLLCFWRVAVGDHPEVLPRVHVDCADPPNRSLPDREAVDTLRVHRNATPARATATTTATPASIDPLRQGRSGLQIAVHRRIDTGLEDRPTTPTVRGDEHDALHRVGDRRSSDVHAARAPGADPPRCITPLAPQMCGWVEERSEVVPFPRDLERLLIDLGRVVDQVILRPSLQVVRGRLGRERLSGR